MSTRGVVEEIARSKLIQECIKVVTGGVWRSEYDDLVQATAAFPKVTKKHLIFFSKGGYTQPVIERAQREGAQLMSISNLF